jgi:hypothetical protein
MSQMPPVQPGYQGPMPGAAKPAGMAIASMVLGIISAVTFCAWYISVPCGIIAICLGMVAKGKINRGEGGGSGMATAGLVLGVIGVAIAILVIVLFFLGVSWMGGKAAEIQKELERQQKLQQQKQQGTSMLPMVYEHVAALWNILGYVVGR